MKRLSYLNIVNSYETNNSIIFVRQFFGWCSTYSFLKSRQNRYMLENYARMIYEQQISALMYLQNNLKIVNPIENEYIKPKKWECK